MKITFLLLVSLWGRGSGPWSSPFSRIAVIPDSRSFRAHTLAGHFYAIRIAFLAVAVSYQNTLVFVEPVEVAHNSMLLICWPIRNVTFSR